MLLFVASRGSQASSTLFKVFKLLPPPMLSMNPPRSSAMSDVNQSLCQHSALDGKETLRVAR